MNGGAREKKNNRGDRQKKARGKKGESVTARGKKEGEVGERGNQELQTEMTKSIDERLLVKKNFFGWAQ